MWATITKNSKTNKTVKTHKTRRIVKGQNGHKTIPGMAILTGMGTMMMKMIRVIEAAKGHSFRATLAIGQANTIGRMNLAGIEKMTTAITTLGMGPSQSENSYRKSENSFRQSWLDWIFPWRRHHQQHGQRHDDDRSEEESRENEQEHKHIENGTETVIVGLSGGPVRGIVSYAAGPNKPANVFKVGPLFKWKTPKNQPNSVGNPFR